MQADLSDEALLSRFRKTKDPIHFKSLIRRYQNRLFNSAFRILGNSEEAEDLVQETCIKVHQGIDNFRRDASFSAWIFRIAHNGCLDILRNRQRKGNPRMLTFDPVFNKDSDGIGEAANNAVANAADPSPGPEEQLEVKEEGEIVAEKLRELPENQLTVLVLHDIDGMSYQEIAEIVGTNIGTVRSRVHYGRLKLKELLDSYYAQKSVSSTR